MQLEVGSILEGKVTGITKFGAFVELPDKVTGMVHISEVAATFVKEIRDFVTEGQTVKVKVLSIGEDGKISLSIKKAQAPLAEDCAFHSLVFGKYLCACLFAVFRIDNIAPIKIAMIQPQYQHLSSCNI